MITYIDSESLRCIKWTADFKGLNEKLQQIEQW